MKGQTAMEDPKPYDRDDRHKGHTVGINPIKGQTAMEGHTVGMAAIKIKIKITFSR
jgi:hypothetical protein